MSRIINLAEYSRKLPRGESKESRTYCQELDRILDELFEDAVKIGYENWTQIADSSGLSRTCVENLGERITKRPQLRTVLMLAAMVGKTLVFKANASQKAVLRLHA